MVHQQMRGFPICAFSNVMPEAICTSAIGHACGKLHRTERCRHWMVMESIVSTVLAEIWVCAWMCRIWFTPQASGDGFFKLLLGAWKLYLQEIPAATTMALDW